ncbi:CoA transferase [Mycobacterium sp. 236(2023)]|uniref:CoA transferase n=1 Tax=Mycobacterium sp. 236(2023) TaxID=3038163 RepID=UPI0024158F68|nr:CoA transferase [Mycobacterium sp. 236(2023)]MDG4669179.1 CoA transferase [Mycobacterium sp. 236(2023)]
MEASARPLGSHRPLAGVRVIEISSFVAVPLAGMTLAQLGAEVIRVDPIGGAADYHRWPVTEAGESIYWAGLNNGKRSAAVDMRSAAGQQLIQRLIVDAGVLITNVSRREWHSYETLSALRADLIHVEVSVRADGGTGVDYTVNAAIGFPLITGPADLDVPVNHVLPVWDISCGIYAALAVTAALRHRDHTGAGQRLNIPLENVALATAVNLSFLTEVMINGTPRERIGNAIFGQYGQQFASSDGAVFMMAALTNLFTTWFSIHSADEVATALARTSILWERYRSFAEVVTDPKVTENPLFAQLVQPRIGEYLAPGLPLAIDGAYPVAVAAPALGDHTADVLRSIGVADDEISALLGAGTVA